MGEYSLWQQERKTPTPPSKRHERSTNPFEMCGFFRIEAARTKIDYPVAIWIQDGASGRVVIFKIGAGAKDGESLFAWPNDEARVADFLGGSWLDCVAISREVYDAAMTTGRWEDGKAARKIGVEEKHDIIPAAKSSEGRGTNVPVDENGNEIDEFHAQIAEKIAKLLEESRTLKVLDTQAKAERAAKIREDLKELFDLGEARRVAEKKPYDDGVKAVQAKWTPVLDPVATARKWLLDLIDKFQKAERQRLAEQQRREAEAAAAEAAQKAEEEARAANPGATEEEIAETARQAADAVREEVQAAPVAAPRVGTAHGRAQSKRTYTYGRVAEADREKFLIAVKDHVDVVEFIAAKATKLARAGAVVPGLETYQE